MSLPKDPVMLLSVVNTKLRDYYPNLDELAKAEGVYTNKENFEWLLNQVKE